MRTTRRKHQSGVTLIEMLVVVTIIGLFAAVVAPGLFRKVDDAHVVACRTQMRAIATALGAYRLDTGAYPTTDDGLGALRAAPAGVERWKGPYMPEEIPADPWGRPFLYKSELSGQPVVVSLGADGKPGGEGIAADIEVRG